MELGAGALSPRPWREDNDDDVVAARQEPVMRLWTGLPATTRPDALALLRRRGDWTAGDHASWAVTEAVTGALLGSVSLHSIAVAQGNAQVGYWTVPAARGRAVAVRAVDAACRWAFAAVPLERVELCHAVENTASGRVAGKAGFTLEGRLRRSYRYGDGLRHDELIWSRLADDPAPALGS